MSLLSSRILGSRFQPALRGLNSSFRSFHRCSQPNPAFSTLTFKINAPHVSRVATALRYSSTTSAATAAAQSSTETASKVSEAVSSSPFDVLDHVSIIPLQYGDLAELGLTHWANPAGWIRWTFELINVTTGLPWFWTIVVGTVCWRLIQLPLAIQSLQQASRLMSIKPQITEIQKEIEKEKMQILKSVKAQKLSALQKSAGWDPIVAIRSPIIQTTIQLALFFAVGKLCRYPVVQLTQSGFWILPDLTAADPNFIILPAIFYALLRMNIHTLLSSPDLTLDPKYGTWARVGLDVSWILPLTLIKMPVGVLVYFITTGIFSLAQSLAFQNPKVRKRFKIRPAPKKPENERFVLPPSRVAWTEALEKVKERWHSRKAEYEGR
ncbi:60Kd inner membrane protein-domain-containing protein [Mycena floridula]|nr:60Kd inner membrane protein-domain-containing protein [Mycena floridula]